MSDDLDRKRLEDEMRHYKAQLAGKLGRLRIMLGSFRRPWGSDINPYYYYGPGEVARLAREMGHIGLKYLALRERLEG